MEKGRKLSKSENIFVVYLEFSSSQLSKDSDNLYYLTNFLHISIFPSNDLKEEKENCSNKYV